ncbi:MAG: CoA transferase [Actinomycetes bacterium]
MSQFAQGPLSNVVVVDLSRALAGPHAAMMLGDMGARVIKVENPDGGDDTRGWGPPFVGEPAESTYFLSCNRNKESITLDLKSEEGKLTLRRLIKKADVLVENFRPGVLARLGFGSAELEALNPRLVTLSISGFGHDGPQGTRAGYDQIAQGEAGLMSLTGPDSAHPTRVGVPIGDLLAGMYGAYGVVAALNERNATGKGSTVHTSLLASIVGVHAFQGTRYTVAGEIPQATGNHHPSIVPYGLFSCADGSLQMAVGSEILWRSFAEAFGLVRDEYDSNAKRVGKRVELLGEIDAIFLTWKSEDLLRELDRVGIPAGRVRTLDSVYEWDQTLSQGLVMEVEHTSLGKIKIPGPPIRIDGVGVIGHRPTPLPPPRLGEHNESVRTWLEEA